MMLGPSCGIWPTRRGLAAAVVELDGPTLCAAYLPDGETDRALWLSHVQALHGAGLELVFTECTARHDPLAHLALELGHRVWIAPRNLAVAMARAAWWRPRPHQLAAMLARFPRLALLRCSLRVAPPNPGPRQLRLFDPRPRRPIKAADAAPIGASP